MKLTNSPIDKIHLFGRSFFIKRDDLLHPEFSGNKARKFKSLLDTDSSDIKHIVSFGSCQANSLYSLSSLAKAKGWSFSFYVDRIPEHLKVNPIGNYAAALSQGADVKVFPTQLKGDEAKEAWLAQQYTDNPEVIVVPEGGRYKLARYGVHQLAAEIAQWAEGTNQKQLKVFLPSGTGTTALFLQEFFDSNHFDIQVLTCAVVSDDEYLRQQFHKLIDDKRMHPKILNTPQRFHFGKLNKKLFDIWRQANECGVEFELLYDPVGLITLQHHLSKLINHPIMYIHQGGLLANETMLLRYKRKYNAGRYT